MIEISSLIPFVLVIAFIGVAQLLIRRWSRSNDMEAKCELSHSGISNSYSSTKDVFQTLEDAKIPPCFLGDVNDEE